MEKKKKPHTHSDNGNDTEEKRPHWPEMTMKAMHQIINRSIYVELAWFLAEFMWASEWPEFHKNKKIAESQKETQNEIENENKNKNKTKIKFKFKTKNQNRNRNRKTLCRERREHHFKLKIYLISTSWAKWARHQQHQHHQQQQREQQQ